MNDLFVRIDAVTDYLILHGWLDDKRVPPQSNSAQRFALELYEEYPTLSADEGKTIVDLVDIVLEHNADPHDTDLIGTAYALLEYMRRREG